MSITPDHTAELSLIQLTGQHWWHIFLVMNTHTSFIYDMQPGELQLYEAMRLFHDTCVGTNIWGVYDVDGEMKNLSSLCAQSSVNSPNFSGGYKQSHDSVQDESMMSWKSIRQNII